MSNTNIFYKDPDSTLDYKIDWEDWLNGDTISTSSWTAQTGLTVESDTRTTMSATVVVSGGTAGQNYTVTNEITTSGGLTDQRSIKLFVRQR